MATHRTKGIVETDMATLAAARQAKADLDAWLLSLPGKRRLTPDDMQRVASDLADIASGQNVVEKYLRLMHEQGWET